MKKIFTLLVLLAMLPFGLRGQDVESNGLWGENEVQGFNGEGSENSPYEISTAAELAYLAQQVNEGETYSGKYFILTNDIVLNENVLDENGDLVNGGTGLKEWTPIGSEDNMFKGTFDGGVYNQQGEVIGRYSIKGLYINNTAETHKGLFGYIDEGGLVKNLSVDDGYINVKSHSGAISAVNYGVIENCINSCSLYAAEGYLGGISGVFDVKNTISKMYYCDNKGIIKSESGDYIGGIFGYSVTQNPGNLENNGLAGEVKYCQNYGDVLGKDCVGGIGGKKNTKVVCCRNEGEISGNNYVGGIIGYSDNNATFHLHNQGSVSGKDYVGGISGYHYFGELVDSKWFSVSRSCNIGIVDCAGHNKAGISNGNRTNVTEYSKYLIDNCKGCIDEDNCSATLEEFKDGRAVASLVYRLHEWVQELGVQDFPVLKCFNKDLPDVCVISLYKEKSLDDLRDYAFNPGMVINSFSVFNDVELFEGKKVKRCCTSSSMKEENEIQLPFEFTESFIQDNSNTDGQDNWWAEFTDMTYTVKFNPNYEGAEETMVSQVFDYNTPSKLRGNEYLREGYIFKNWNTKENGEGEYYGDMAELTFTGNEDNIILYAQWEANTYTVKFDANGGKGEMESQQFSHGVAQKLQENGFTKEGYTLTSWNTSADGQGKKYEIGKDIQVTSDLTLYAQWEANTYTVKFNANGGEGTMDDIQLTYDQSQALTKNNFTKAGYTFVGWSTVQDGEVIYGDEENVENLASEGEFTLYAVWRLDTSVGGGYHDLYIVESVGAELISRYDKDRTPDGGSFTLSLEKEEGYEDCEPTVYYKRGRFGDWKELKLDEVSGYYQIGSVYTDIYVKVSGDGIWPVSNEEVEAQEVKVYTQNGAIVVVTPSVMDVQVVSMTGSVVAADKVAGQREFRNLVEGVYIVRVEDEIVKVRL